MARTLAIGEQSFEKIRKSNIFYVDKTHFIKEWWEKYGSKDYTRHNEDLMLHERQDDIMNEIKALEL